MAALLSALLLAFQIPPLVEAPRLRTILPNGAAVMVERIPNAKVLSVQLFVGAAPAPDTGATSGLRHLLEHLAARGRDGSIDLELETAGAFLQARTYRPATVYEVTLGPGQLQLGLKAVAEVLHSAPATPEGIAKEAVIIGQEGALRDDTARLGAAAWTQAYGDAGADPFGNLDVIRAATPQALSGLRQKLEVGGNVAISIAGDVNVDEATRLASETISGLSKANYATPAPDSDHPSPGHPILGHPGTAQTDARGEVRAAIVGSYRDIATAATLAAGLAVASEMDDAFLTYTPSDSEGLIIVGRTDRRQDVQEAFDKAKPEELFGRGRALAERWVERQLESPSSVAFARGLLLVENSSLKPETLVENLKTMSFDEFKRGLARFQGAAAVTVEGAR